MGVSATPANANRIPASPWTGGTDRQRRRTPVTTGRRPPERESRGLALDAGISVHREGHSGSIPTRGLAVGSSVRFLPTRKIALDAVWEGHAVFDARVQNAHVRTFRKHSVVLVQPEHE